MIRQGFLPSRPILSSCASTVGLQQVAIPLHIQICRIADFQSMVNYTIFKLYMFFCISQYLLTVLLLWDVRQLVILYPMGVLVAKDEYNFLEYQG